MSTYSVRRMIRSFAFFFIVAGATASAALGQTPSATPAPAATPVPITPAQRDATRPPGTQQNQPVPPQSRPATDPTAPPGVVRPAPNAPPGITVAPQTTQPATTDTTVTPAPAPSPNAPIEGGSTQLPADQSPIREPNFPGQQARPLPPLPDLTRLGVESGNMLSLTLNDAIRLALENNNDIEVARGDVKFSETTLRALEGVFDPVFTFNPQFTRLVQSQPSSLGGAVTLTQSDFQNNTDLSKTFSTGGGTYDVFFNTNRRTTNNSFNLLNPTYSSSMGVTFTPPLWRNRSIDRNRRDIRIQRKRLEQTDADFRQRTIDVIAQVQRAYWDLVFSLRDQENRISNLNLTRENLRRVEAQIAAGASAPLERAEVETEMANRESDLLLANQNVSIAENNLKQLMLRDPNAPQWSAQLTPTDNPTFDSVPVNLNDALEEAKTNRPELRRLNLQRDINNIDIQFFKNQTKPRIDIQTTLATTGLAGAAAAGDRLNTTSALISGDPATNANAFLLDALNATRRAVGLAPLDAPLVTAMTTGANGNLVGGFGQNLRNLFTFNTYNLVGGVTIQFPFRNRTAEANLAGARIQSTQLDASIRSQEQAVIVEVRNAAQAVETARRRVLSARAARENAELQLAGEQRLYQVGRSTTFLLFQRENTLANARNAELRAETDYNKALADLQRATSTTLRANNVTIDSSTAP
ncbi:MAG: TolC family protein [Acidobacteria bacterium]|nr:TolC family protein [Acidobacteriota bacterium]